MKSMRYLAIVSVLILMPLTYAHAAVSVGIGVGVGPGYVGPAPVCSYGYYGYYPYACAPYGFYGANWFVNGIFIGAGPWYHGWGHPYWGPGAYYGRGFSRVPVYGHGPVVARGFSAHGGSDFHSSGGFHGGFHGGGRR
jgi:hypothetical protein